MKTLQIAINEYIIFCKIQKRLNSKTLKAYQIDFYLYSLDKKLSKQS